MVGVAIYQIGAVGARDWLGEERKPELVIDGDVVEVRRKAMEQKSSRERMERNTRERLEERG